MNEQGVGGRWPLRQLLRVRVRVAQLLRVEAVELFHLGGELAEAEAEERDSTEDDDRDHNDDGDVGALPHCRARRRRDVLAVHLV